MSRPPDSSDLTRLLGEASAGDPRAFDALLPLVYEELKKLAAVRLRGEREGHTLNATALVHETYLKLVDHDCVAWNSRAHFYAVSSEAMRRILIDHARGRRRAKRGGASDPIPLDGLEAVLGLASESLTDWDDLLALDEALEGLSAANERAGRIVQYRFFGGLTPTDDLTARSRFRASCWKCSVPRGATGR
jgi:RNA polymerase sigma factor (TIGR02999 family)